MNVLQIGFSDYQGGGGGAIAMYHLYRSLNSAGVEGKILSGIKTLESPESEAISRLPRLESQLRRITSRLGLNDIHCLSSFQLKQHEFYQQAELVNFHVIHSGFFNYLAIPALTQSKPAVFTLHDMWHFTGHCAYSFDCDRWKIGCGNCPYPDSYPAIKKDNTRLEWKLKNWVYTRSNLSIITPSRWLAQQAKQSMLNCFPINCVPNGIDTEAYQPLNPEQCRSVLGIPTGKKVLMFSAQSLKEYRKGGDILLKALSNLPVSLKAETVLLTLGNGGKTISEAVDMQSIELGYVSSDRLKSLAYSAADLFIFPTRADNLPLVLQESMACGTPMVSFKIGGVPDLVRSGVTGYLAQPEDAIDLSNGIVQLLEDDAQREKMSQNCRAIALAEYPLELQAQRYIELYTQAIQKRLNPVRVVYYK